MTASPSVTVGMDASESCALPAQADGNANHIPTTTPTVEADLDILPICSFPSEVIEKIASNLQLKDVSSLRLVCKGLEAKSFHRFSRTYFRIITTDLSAESLRKVKAIAEHKSLKDCVEIMRLTRIGERRSGEGFSWPWHNHQYVVVSPHPAVGMLRDILIEKLVKCRSFSVGSDYGPTFPLSIEVLWRILLCIMTETGLPVRSIHLKLTGCFLGGFFARNRFRTPQLLHLWANLRELSLSCLPELDGVDAMVEIVSHAPDLQKLKLHFFEDQCDTVADTVISTFLERLSSLKSLPKIRELHLGGREFKDSYLVMLLRRLGPHLRTLVFEKFGLAIGGSWANVLGELKNDLSSLKKFFIRNVGTLDRSWPGYPCRFDYITFDTINDAETLSGVDRQNLQPFESNGHVVGVKYEGPHMSKALDMIMGAIDEHLPLEEEDSGSAGPV